MDDWRQPGIWCWILCALLTLQFAGCAGGAPSGRANGKVSNNGENVAGAQIVFQSTTNTDDLFTGVSTADGTYQIDYRAMEGMPPGKYNVTIRRYTLPGGKPLPEGEAGDELMDQGKVVTSTFAFEQEIAEGENAIDFDLTKGKKKSS